MGPPQDPTQCKFYGRAFHAPCDTHVITVDGDTMICTEPKRSKFHELASAQDAQLLPLAIVFFSRSAHDLSTIFLHLLIWLVAGFVVEFVVALVYVGPLEVMIVALEERRMQPQNCGFCRD